MFFSTEDTISRVYKKLQATLEETWIGFPNSVAIFNHGIASTLAPLMAALCNEDYYSLAILNVILSIYLVH